MSPPSLFAAKIIEASASAYASSAASRLLERHPEVAERFAPSALSEWKSHLTQRILELAAALGVEEPDLFVARIQWLERAFRARDLVADDVRAGLVCLREVLGEELPEAARGAAVEPVDRALSRLAEAPAATGFELDPANPMGRLALSYLQKVLEGDSRGAVDLVVDAVDDGLSPADAYLEVLLPAQREVGTLWHVGELSIAEEHFVTATTERTMAVVARRIERPAANGKTMIAAAVAGNQHDLAIRVVADFFEMAGWRAVCLGADVPAADLATAAQYFDAQLLALSVSLDTQLRAVRRSVEAIRGLADRQVAVLVGGLAFADVPDLWRRLGADGYAARPDAAVEVGAGLL